MNALSFAALLLVSPAHAQAQGEQRPDRYWATPDHEGWVTDNTDKKVPAQPGYEIIEKGGVVLLTSREPGVRGSLSWKGFLLWDADLERMARSKGFSMNGVLPWDDAVAIAALLDHALALAKRVGKLTGREELNVELAALRWRVKALETQDKAETVAADLDECAREEYELSKVDVKGISQAFADLESVVAGAKTGRELVLAARAVDLFKLTLPKQ